MSRLPSGTVTFLFTDIQGSTERWEREPETMREALRRHDEILRQAIERHDGQVFKTVGDAFCAVFSLATNAMAAASEAQSFLQRESTDGLQLPRVRMALHTGSAEERNSDYFGPTVNRVARLCDITHGGQTLLSQATYELIRDSIPSGTTVVSLGGHQLKDLERPEEVFQLNHLDLPSEFPPLRSLHGKAHNLPIQLTSFIGREREIAEVRRLLTETRLLTLIGSGGCGKTRLALQSAAELVDLFPDGVWLVQLAPLRDPSLVPWSVASVLRLREEPGGVLAEALSRYLGTKQMLLILDNCDHVAESCAAIADKILHDAPNVRILATSREPLAVSGEAVWSVPPLTILDPRHLSESEKLHLLRANEAVRLFVERAKLGQPGFELNDHNVGIVAGICWRLDGIPLAIELAAGRIRSLSLEEILVRLSDRFTLLTGGSRTALPHHQTLRAAMDWSHEALSLSERALFRRLSVFVGGWSLTAAEAVASDTLDGNAEGHEKLVCPTELANLLSQLVDKSLVLMQEGGADTRYRFFETVREYARGRLQEAGEREECERRHRDFFLTLAEEAYGNRLGQYRMHWIERLILEEHNLRAAIEWSFESEVNVEIGLRMAAAVGTAWYQRGMIDEIVRWTERGLGAESISSSTRLRALVALAWTKVGLRRAQEAETLADEALKLAIQLGDRDAILELWMKLADIALGRNDFAGAKRHGENILALSNEVDHARIHANTLLILSGLARREGRTDQMADLYQRAMELVPRVGPDPVVALNLAHRARDLGNLPEALNRYREALQIAARCGSRLHTLWSIAGAGSQLVKMGDIQKGIRLIAAYDALREQMEVETASPTEWDSELLVASRRELGEEVFKAAWEAGRSMSEEEAIAAALEE